MNDNAEIPAGYVSVTTTIREGLQSSDPVIREFVTTQLRNAAMQFITESIAGYLKGAMEAEITFYRAIIN